MPSSRSNDVASLSGVIRPVADRVEAEKSMMTSPDERDVDGRPGDDAATSPNSGRYMTLRHKASRSTSTGDFVDGARGATSQLRRERSRDSCRPLRHWLYGHRDTPYPSRADKQHLSAITQLSFTQVSNWFANARRRLKNTVDRSVQPRGRDDWARRIRLYNKHTVGNQERLSISSDDTAVDDLLDDDDNDDLEQFSMCERLDGQSMIRLNEGVDLSATDVNQAAAPTAAAAARHHLASSPSFQVADAGYFAVEPGSPAGGVDDRRLADADIYRCRNASGSLSSHDYEETSSTASPTTSERGSPTRDHRQRADGGGDWTRVEEFTPGINDYLHYPCLDSSATNDVMHWKEISAALALTTLARSRGVLESAAVWASKTTAPI